MPTLKRTPAPPKPIKLPTLEDMTKEQLLVLFKQRNLSPPPREIAFVIWMERSERTMAQMDVAHEKMEKLTPTSSSAQRSAYFAANAEWERAWEAHQKNQQWYDTICAHLEENRR